MSGEEFFVCSIVEGHGERKSLPKLLHKIWGEMPARLRTDEEPYRVRNGIFFNKSERRRRALNWAKDFVQYSGNGGVLILMDADEACCKVFLQGGKMRAVCADIKKILGNIPCVVVLIERKYESWLAAGLGGRDGGAEEFLGEYLGRSYKKTQDEVGLIGDMDIERAAENNPSFCRFRERLLEWRGGEGKVKRVRSRSGRNKRKEDL